MPIDPNIALNAKPLNLSETAQAGGQGFSQGFNVGTNIKRIEQNQQNQDLQKQLLEQQIAQTKFKNLDQREQQRLNSSIMGAAQLNNLLKNNNVQGAESFLLSRRQNLQNRIAAGENVDTRETDEALQLLKENPQQLLNTTDSLVNFGQQIGVLQASKDNRPADIRSFEEFQTFSPEKQQQFKDFKKSGTSTTNVNVGSENSFNKEFGKQNAQQFFENATQAKEAKQTLQSSVEARKLLDSGIISGFGADFRVGLGKALKQAGFDIEDDPIANTEAFVGQRAKEVGRIIKLFGAGTGLSDTDREFATKAAAGDISLNEKSLRKLLDIGDKAARNIVTDFNSRVDQLPQDLSPFNLRVDISDIPEASNEQKQSGGIKFLGFE